MITTTSTTSPHTAILWIRPSTVIALLMLVAGIMLASAQPAHATAVEFTDPVSGITYSLDAADATATVIDYDPDVGGHDAVIPATVTHESNAYSVTTIGSEAFGYKALTSVVVPDSVTTISDYAFPFNDLTTATIPDSVTTIGDFAFAANSLATVTIPDSITTLGGAVFAFNKLTNVTIPNSVTTIGDAAFTYNDLTTVTIPDSVTTIGAQAFSINNLTDVTIPNSVTTIGERAFSYNDLTTVTIPHSVTIVSDSAFSDNKLTTVTIPDSVTTIGAWAFSFNDLTTLTIPNSVTTIEERAFSVNNLTDVTIPNSVTTIGEQAFSINNLTDVTIPNSVTDIGDYAFASNDLTTVTIGSSVTTIGNAAFVGNGSLSTVIFKGDAPTITAVGNVGSFGPAEDKTLFYRNQAQGFDSPLWRGYTTAVLYTVTFDANGGTGTVPSQSAFTSSALGANIFTRIGHDFAGWNTEAGGTGESYSDGDTYDFTADVTLYAQWAIHTYSVTFDTGAGTDIAPVAVDYGNTVILPTDDPTLDEYTFTGWYTDQPATTLYDFDTEVTGDVTLYAGWEAVTDPVVIEDEDDVTLPATIEEDSVGEKLASTGGTLNSPAFVTALLAIFTGAALLVYRRWARTTT